MGRFRLALALVPLALLLVAAAGGCSTYYYEIVLRPDGDAIERQLTCWKQRYNTAVIEDFPRDRLEKIATAYAAVPAAKLNQKHSFSGRFIGQMPHDVGGSGTYTRWTTPFGVTAAYMERFGGNDDIARQIEDGRQATNRIVDLGIGWLETELAGQPNWQDLRRFLDTQVRHDLENLSCTLFVEVGAVQELETDAPAPKKNAEGTFGSTTSWMRLWQYLVERGYVEPRDLPSIVRSDEQSFFPWLERLVARRLGLTADVPKPAAMAFLANTKAAEASLDRYLRTTPEFHKLERAWQEEKKANPEKSPPEPGQVFGELFGDAFLKISFNDNTQLKITLACGEAPSETNGIWDEDERQVYWRTTKKGDWGLPTFVFAMWSVALPEAQINQFGKVVLTGENLSAYVMWYHGLSKHEAAEWDAMLATLHPGPDLLASLKAFRFSSDPPLPANAKEPVPNSLADEPRRLIKIGLSNRDER